MCYFKCGSIVLLQNLVQENNTKNKKYHFIVKLVIIDNEVKLEMTPK